MLNCLAKIGKCERKLSIRLPNEYYICALRRPPNGFRIIVFRFANIVYQLFRRLFV